MNHKNKIVRILYVYNHDDPSRIYYEYKLMTFKDWAYEQGYVEYGGPKRERKKYKWYSVKALWELPAFWLLLKIYRGDTKRITKVNTIVVRIGFFIIEASAAGVIGYLVTLPFTRGNG